MQQAQSVRFYFSFRSPFAAIALYRLRRAVQFADFGIELIPVWPENVFGGHMDNPTDNLFKMAYIFGDAARQAEEAGLPAEPFRVLATFFKLPKDVDYRREKMGVPRASENWALTHHAFNHAEEVGKGWAFAEAVFMRRFNLDGGGSADVMQPDVLETIAAQVGLDPELAAGAAESGRYDARQAEFVRQSERDGVFGVPFFAIDHADETEMFWGNDRLAFLLKSLTGCARLPVIPPARPEDVLPSRR